MYIQKHFVLTLQCCPCVCAHAQFKLDPALAYTFYIPEMQMETNQKLFSVYGVVWFGLCTAMIRDSVRCEFWPTYNVHTTCIQILYYLLSFTKVLSLLPLINQMQSVEWLITFFITMFYRIQQREREREGETKKNLYTHVWDDIELSRSGTKALRLFILC